MRPADNEKQTVNEMGGREVNSCLRRELVTFKKKRQVSSYGLLVEGKQEMRQEAIGLL